MQCKRYSPGNNVGVREVRDLYGVVTHEKANKGILITTAGFTPDAQEFATDKPLELIDGQKLQELLNLQHLLADSLEQDKMTVPEASPTVAPRGKSDDLSEAERHAGSVDTT